MKREIWTQMAQNRKPCEDEGKNWINASIIAKEAKDCQESPETRKGPGRYSLFWYLLISKEN